MTKKYFWAISIATILVAGLIAPGVSNTTAFAEKQNIVTICHLGQTIPVAEAALARHLAHGDTPFACDALATMGPGVAQQFSVSDPFDLGFSAITFTPAGSSAYTFEVTGPVAAFPEVPGDGTTTETLALTDDDNVERTIPSTPFFGTDYTSFFIGSNGFVTFESGDNDFSESLGEFFSEQPRIAMLWDDLNPALGGTVIFDEYSDRVVVTFEDVPEFFATGANSFQLVLNTNGVITMTYLNVSALDGIVGISSGAAEPFDFN